MRNIRKDMVQLTAIHLLAGKSSITSVLEADECKALRALSFPVFGQKDSCDTAKSLKHISKVLLFRKLAHLQNKIR